MSEFSGFNQAGLTFLQQLAANNDRAWFEAHRDVYQRELLEPMRLLVSALGQEMLAIDDLLEIAPAVGKTLSRIHRDTRFSRDKSPYRSNLWLTFKRTRKNWTDAPTFFFEFAPDWWRCGLGYYSASRTTMALFRASMVQNPTAFLALTQPLLDGFTLEGECYRRPLVKEMEPELASWYNRKTWALIGHHQQMDELFSPDLAPRLAQAFHRLAPLYDFLMKIEAEKRLLPLP